MSVHFIVDINKIMVYFDINIVQNVHFLFAFISIDYIDYIDFPLN